MFIEKNKTSSNSFEQSKHHMYSFRSTKPRLEYVCICGIYVCVCGCDLPQVYDHEFGTNYYSVRESCKFANSDRMYLDMCTYTDVCIYLYIYVYTRTCVCIRMNIWEYIYVYIYRYVYTYIHFYICM